MKSKHEVPCPQNQQEEGELDRISSLPDHLLAHILTLLPLIQAIRTSILSSRWRYVWTFVTQLSLVSFSGLEKFETMLEHVFRHCKSMYLDSIHLACPETKDLSLVEGWVSSTLSRHPKELVVVIGNDFFKVASRSIPPYPRCVLTYNTMVVFKLMSCFEVEIPDSVVSFPCLEILHFMGRYPYHNFVLGRLISMCPVLKELRLRGYLESYTQHELDISIPSLRALDLELTEFVIDDDEEEEAERESHTIIINTSNLECLNIHPGTLTHYVGGNFESIVSAHIDYDRPSDGVADYLISQLLEILKRVAKAKCLSLSLESVVILEAAPRVRWPTFPNLTILTLWTCGPCGWKLLCYCLETSPNLQCLLLYKDRSYEVNSLDDQLVWHPPKEVPECLKLNLRIVKFESFQGCKDELEIVKYLLNNAQVLEFMVITTCPYPLDGGMAESIAKFPRASQTCQVNVRQQGSFLYGLHQFFSYAEMRSCLQRWLNWAEESD